MSISNKLSAAQAWIRADKRVGWLLALLSVHLVLVAIVAAASSIYTYSKFYYNDAPRDPVYPLLDRVANGSALKPYLEFAGINRGYGFFAPNVLSSGRVIFQIDGKTVGPRFRTREGINRYNTLCSKFVSQAVAPKMSSDTNMVLGRFPSYWKLDSTYNDLLLKNIAAHVLQHYPGKDSISASLFLYDFPNLSEYRAGNREPKNYLMYSKIFSRHP